MYRNTAEREFLAYEIVSRLPKDKQKELVTYSIKNLTKSSRKIAFDILKQLIEAKFELKDLKIKTTVRTVKLYSKQGFLLATEGYTYATIVNLYEEMCNKSGLFESVAKFDKWLEGLPGLFIVTNSTTTSKNNLVVKPEFLKNSLDVSRNTTRNERLEHLQSLINNCAHISGYANIANKVLAESFSRVVTKDLRHIKPVKISDRYYFSVFNKIYDEDGELVKNQELVDKINSKLNLTRG